MVDLEIDGDRLLVKVDLTTDVTLKEHDEIVGVCRDDGWVCVEVARDTDSVVAVVSDVI